MYVKSLSGQNGNTGENPLGFAYKIKVFREHLVPGHYLKVYPSTGNSEIDHKMRLAIIEDIYPNYVHLKDDKGFHYGPTYPELFSWGN